MINWIIEKVIRGTGKKFDGHKSKIAGLGFFLLGCVDILTVAMPSLVVEYGIPQGTYEGASVKFATAFGIWGIAGKIQKNTKILNE